MSTNPRDIRLRVLVMPDVPIGPGKAALLHGIKETGSIAAAGRRMGMSYKRAWYLIDTLNGHFGQPMVETVKGGRNGGGAKLTSLGEQVLASYREMEELADKAITPALKRLRCKLPS
ncbi:MAG: winged helix-turn-helix domain-containing protein [Alphaproteobacteria bacterium]|nr:winged helix-turn-helix domain-containing protein [Alphaproteobacteria bacterium]